MLRTPKSFGGFTLIELLIVVAIIAILAAIAVPNFLEAQVRAKVSRAKSDLRTFATALESYIVDNNTYPQANDDAYLLARAVDVSAVGGFNARVMERLSTPIAYISNSGLVDSFASKENITPAKTGGTGTVSPIAPAEILNARYYRYTAFATGSPTNVTALVNPQIGLSAKSTWAMWSAGPRLQAIRLRGSNLLASTAFTVATDEAIMAWFYDPTNGTVSQGNIFRIGGTTTGTDNEPGGKWLRLAYGVTGK